MIVLGEVGHQTVGLHQIVGVHRIMPQQDALQTALQVHLNPPPLYHQHPYGIALHVDPDWIFFFKYLLTIAANLALLVPLSVYGNTITFLEVSCDATFRSCRCYTICCRTQINAILSPVSLGPCPAARSCLFLLDFVESVLSQPLHLTFMQKTSKHFVFIIFIILSLFSTSYFKNSKIQWKYSMQCSNFI